MTRWRSGSRFTAVLLLLLAGGPVLRAQDLRGLADGLPAVFPLPAAEAAGSGAVAGGGKFHPAVSSLIAGYGTKSIRPGTALVPNAAGKVPLTLIANSEADAAAVVRKIAEVHGDVMENLGTTILARIPPEGVGSFASLDALYYAAPQPLVYPLQEDTRSFTEGVRATGVDGLHKFGVTGSRVKVGVLDFGFRGYGRLVDMGQLPRPKAAKAWNSDNNIDAGPTHGTACAEIIHAMAPEAEIYLAAMGGAASSLDQFAMAAEWLASQGVKIISFSGGTHEGPHNGRGPMDIIVERIVKRYDILWINAAGNEGTSHWSGLTVDRNSDGWIDVSGTSPYLIIRPHTETLSLLVTWDDWGQNPLLPQSFQDVDAYLFPYEAVRAGRLAPLARSELPQNGRGSPIEKIGPITVKPNAIFVLGLRAKHVTKASRIHVYSLTTADIEPHRPEGSVIVPATSALVVAVGAINLSSNGLESFSSQGPTDDGRVKPDLTAPDGNTSESAFGGRFGGTSAAGPHAAGFAALIKQIDPVLNGGGLRDQLGAAVKPRGISSPNNSYGYGEIDALKLKERLRFADSVLNHLSANAGRFQVGGLQLILSVSAGSYKVGYKTPLTVTASLACYCQLYYRDQAGRYELVFSTEDPIPPGQHWLGNLTIIPPPGSEEFLLVGSLTHIMRDRVVVSNIPPLTVVMVPIQVIP